MIDTFEWCATLGCALDEHVEQCATMQALARRVMRMYENHDCDRLEEDVAILIDDRYAAWKDER